jgi:hypothetical protein
MVAPGAAPTGYLGVRTMQVSWRSRLPRRTVQAPPCETKPETTSLDTAREWKAVQKEFKAVHGCGTYPGITTDALI